MADMLVNHSLIEMKSKFYSLKEVSWACNGLVQNLAEAPNFIKFHFINFNKYIFKICFFWHQVSQEPRKFRNFFVIPPHTIKDFKWADFWTTLMWICSEIMPWLKFGHFTYWILAQSRTEFNLSKEPCDAWEQRGLQKSSKFLQSFLFQLFSQQVIWFKLNRF